MAEEDPWPDILAAGRAVPYTDTWPVGFFRNMPTHLYVPYWRQQRVGGRRWAEMTYASDAKKSMGGQDDPEWDHLCTTAIIGLDGQVYDLREYVLHYNMQVYLGESPSSLRQLGSTHDQGHSDAKGPALSHHFCRPAYRLPNLHTSATVGVRLFRLTGDDIRGVMQGLLIRTFHWPHLGALNVTCSDQFPWRDLFRVHPCGRTLVGAGLIRILICADTEHPHPYFIIHRKVHARHATAPGNSALEGPSPPDLLVQYPYLEPHAAKGVECMRMDLYHDARVVCAHWKDFCPASRMDNFPYLDVQHRVSPPGRWTPPGL